MKTLKISTLIALTASVVCADPSEEEKAFCLVTGAKALSSDRKEFTKTEMPEALLSELQKYYFGGGEDKTYVHKYEGFMFDLNMDDQPEYFVHNPSSSGSGGSAYMIFSKFGDEWKLIGDYQGALWVFPTGKGWARIAHVGRGGGGNWTKVFSEFKEAQYEPSRIVRYSQGEVTEEIPKKKD